MSIRPRTLLFLGPVLVLAGCLGPSKYPSLALRPIEDVSLAEPAPPPASPSTPRDVADVRYAPLIEKARKGDAEFRRELAEATPVLTRGRTAAIGSDAWAEAQQTLSRLQGYRTPVAEAAAAVQSASEEPDTHTDSGREAAAAAALATVQAIDKAEADALERLTPRKS